MSARSNNDILIAVLGVTGAGKTTFISKSTGRTDLVIGHGVESCTQDISFSTLQVAGKKVTLIDTPGFDDTERTDADVLESIAKFLSETYANGMLLTGIVLLQPVTGNRVQGSEKRRTRLFEKVCGPNAFGHVVIATTMWSDLRDEWEGHSRVRQRKDAPDFWGNMIHQGADVVKHDNTAACAISIIRKLMYRNTVTLQMQSELHHNDGRLSATSAGQQLHNDLGETSQKVLAQLESMQKELRQANREKAALREEIQELQDRYTSLAEQQSRLQDTRVHASSTAPAWITALATVGATAAAAYPIGLGSVGRPNYQTQYSHTHHGSNVAKGAAAGCCACMACCCCCSVM